MRKPLFQLFQSSHGKQPWRWRLVGKNGEVVAQSEGYASRGSAKRASQRLAVIAIAALMAGCGSFERRVEYVPYAVKQEVAVPCVVEWPPEPIWETSTLRKTDDLDTKVRALLVEIAQRITFQSQLMAAAQGCKETP